MAQIPSPIRYCGEESLLGILQLPCLRTSSPHNRPQRLPYLDKSDGPPSPQPGRYAAL
ncbi:hypothetical protein BT67DRAFT_100737 [Trichocladium antarcticum]|uniref:Uncharacterized protein n=1 Tax=Trichocladium antarcticum TaxID=1450529 RepID=A0AAN6ZFI9_9PEZI|nr:hypothetical protein BT67DRAFT_100737 [Trichocladium antarcticum]